MEIRRTFALLQFLAFLLILYKRVKWETKQTNRTINQSVSVKLKDLNDDHKFLHHGETGTETAGNLSKDDLNLMESMKSKLKSDNFPLSNTKQIEEESSNLRQQQQHQHQKQQPLSRQQKPRLLTCDEIQKLEILRTIGNGMNKVAFEVKIPGEELHQHIRMLAKRCYTLKCYTRNFVQKEAALFKDLQEHYGTKETVGYFGECAASGVKLVEQMLAEEKGNAANTLEDISRNFSVGFTSVVELGKPLISEHMLMDKLGNPLLGNHPENGRKHTCYADRRKCLALHFTESDVEDFKTIAQQYANFSSPHLEGANRHRPLVLRRPSRQNTDNCKLEQYALMVTGRIHHVDLDMVYECPDCTYDDALEVNCSVLRDLLDDKTLNCNKNNTVTDTAASLIDHHRDHINITEALNQCSKTVK